MGSKREVDDDGFGTAAMTTAGDVSACVKFLVGIWLE